LFFNNIIEYLNWSDPGNGKKTKKAHALKMLGFEKQIEEKMGFKGC